MSIGTTRRKQHVDEIAKRRHVRPASAWRKGDDILDRDGRTIWRIQILKGHTMLATKVETKTMKQTGIKLTGYVLKDGKLVRDPKHLDASQRRKRQAAAMKRKKGTKR